MKKAIILLTFIAFTISLKSQEYYPLLENNKTWNVLSVEYIPGDPYYDTTYSTINYKLMGDTLINSYLYFKLYKNEEEYPVNWNLNAFIREDVQKRIWLLNDAVEEEYLMYDFGVEQGDIVNVGINEPVLLTVDSITEVEINGDLRQKYWLSYGNYYKETWTTGIGSNKGIIYSGSAFITGGWYWLLCVSDINGIIYSNPYYESCYLITSINKISLNTLTTYPNPAKTHITFELPQVEKETNLIIKDVFGKTIAEFKNPSGQSKLLWECSNYSNGVYFYKTEIGGKTYSGKIFIQ